MTTPSEKNPFIISEDEQTIDLHQYIGLFLQWWWLIVLSLILGGSAGFLISSQITPIFQASTTLLINEAPSDSPVDYTNILTSERLAKTYAQMITKRPVLEAAIERLGLNISPEDLREMITVTPVRDTQLITIFVEGPDAGTAVQIADGIALIFSEQLEQTQSLRFAESKESLKAQMIDTDNQINQLRVAIKSATNADEASRMDTRLNQYEQIYSNLLVSYENVRLAEAKSSSTVVSVERAVIDKKPVKPRTLQNITLAAMIGLLLSVGGILANDALDDSVKSPDEIRRWFNLPVLGTITIYEEPEDGTPITLAEPRSPVTESFRALRTNVQYASVDHLLHTLLVTSPTPADGKTYVAANLAIVMAQSGKNVTVIDADLHRPRLHRVLNVDNIAGLSELFVQPYVQLNGAWQPSRVNSLHVVSAGKLPPNPSELLGSNKMGEIINVVQEKSDIVLLDTPPVLSVTDAVVLAPLVDGVLLVVRHGETKMSQLKFAVDQLRYVGANVIGVVVNGIDGHSSRYGYYYRTHYCEAYRDESCKRNNTLNRAPFLNPPFVGNKQEQEKEKKKK